ncbi:IS3 family transposase [Chromobacterium sp. TRC.1.1.SA]|uniref:IS3 family transposase n=1 Tax=Chromobacterium indicum TaxID=3110228 RepID=A0ABV0CJT8_9NEIS
MTNLSPPGQEVCYEKSKFTEEQIAFSLWQAKSGTIVAEVYRKMGISEATFYNWKKKSGGLGVSELRRLKQLEEENARLKRMVTDLSLDKQMLQEVIPKKAVRPARKRELANFLIDAYRVSIRRATAVVQLRQASYFYRPHPRDDRAERQRIREIAATRIRYGARRIHILLRREGWLINHKKTYRIYCEEGLNLRRKRRVAAAHRQIRPAASNLNACWSMVFVVDQLFNSRQIRALTVVDNFSRESLAITVDCALKAVDVVATMRHVQALRGTPQRIQVDNGSEFISMALDQWAYEQGVTLDFSRPGKPTDNAFIESFNGSLRDECLNMHWFLSLDDARDKIECWRQDYNEFRPHSSLGDQIPSEFRLAHLEAGNR